MKLTRLCSHAPVAALLPARVGQEEGLAACGALFAAAKIAGRRHCILSGCTLFKSNCPNRSTKGIVRGHCYAVLGAYEKGDLRLCKLRNTWGRSGEWKGDWGDSSELWEANPGIKEAVGFEKGDDGIFWMKVEDLQQVGFERMGANPDRYRMRHSYRLPSHASVAGSSLRSRYSSTSSSASPSRGTASTRR